MFIVGWRYRVPVDRVDSFEHTYGLEGDWASFFGRSPAYLGSLLVRQSASAGDYLLFDLWSDRASYERFLDVYKNEYLEQSASHGSLYAEEERLGSWESESPL